MNSLNDLPAHLKPIDICLHYNDISLYKPLFDNNGFTTHCVGNIYDDDFAKKFYSLISQYSQVCSNTLGSYTLYSLNLEIPFFLVGDEPTYDNFGNDKNVPIRFKVSDNKYCQKIIPLFKKIIKTVSHEQKQLSTFELGESSRMDSKTLRNVILKSFLGICSNMNNTKSFARALLRPISAKYKYMFK